MKCPTGWKPNPQAMAAVSTRLEFSGADSLRAHAEVDTDTWLTPRFILEHLGPFDLDPCAALANPTWVCPNYLTKEQDGLNSPWSGRVFMNPPFSNTAAWIRKHAEHRLGITLVPASTESGVWRDVVWVQAQYIFLLAGRTRFSNPDGSCTTGRPLRPVALIAWSEADAYVLRTAAFSGVALETWKVR